MQTSILAIMCALVVAVSCGSADDTQAATGLKAPNMVGVLHNSINGQSQPQDYTTGSGGVAGPQDSSGDMAYVSARDTMTSSYSPYSAPKMQVMIATTTMARGTAFCMKTKNAEEGKDIKVDRSTTFWSQVRKMIFAGYASAAFCEADKSMATLQFFTDLPNHFQIQSRNGDLCLSNKLGSSATRAFWEPCASDSEDRRFQLFSFKSTPASKPWSMEQMLGISDSGKRLVKGKIEAFDGAGIRMSSVQRRIERESKGLWRNTFLRMNGEQTFTIQALNVVVPN